MTATIIALSVLIVGLRHVNIRSLGSEGRLGGRVTGGGPMCSSGFLESDPVTFVLGLGRAGRFLLVEAEGLHVLLVLEVADNLV